MYNDNQVKFVAVLNRKILLPRLLNALAHVSAGLIAVRPSVDFRFLRYEYADGRTASISRWPFIVLAAKNSGQIARFREELQPAIDTGQIVYNDFAATMIDSSSDAQLQNTKLARSDEIEFYAAAAFGPAEAIDPLTKRFSLFRVDHVTANQNGEQ